MPADLRSILQIEVPVIVRIGERTMPLADVLALVPGSIIELPKQADDPLEVLVNNKVIGHGRAVKVGENFGTRITTIGAVGQRVLAMRHGSTPVTVPPRRAPEAHTASRSDDGAVTAARKSQAA